MGRWLVLAVLLLGASSVPTPRSSAAVTAFRAQHPCPITGETTGPCPHFVVDHIRPLCFGGADHPENMTWQAVDQALKKDAFERDACGLLRRCHQ